MRPSDSIASILGLALTTLSAACAPGGIDTDSYDVEEEDVAERDDSIIGGSAAAAYGEAVLLDMKQGGFTVSICSGSLVAPRVVLTAGHCVHGFDGWTVTAPFAGGQVASAKSAETFDWTNDGSFVDPNQHDIGLVYLDKSIALSSYPTIATTPLSAGKKVQNIGRIDNGTASYSSLFLGPAVALKSGNYGFPYSYATAETIQSGDSGGPVVVPGTHKIVAVNSGAGGGLQVLARVDLVASWIQSRIAAKGGSASAPAQPADPCGGIDYVGACQGGNVVWCENAQLKSLDCTAGGRSCAFDGQNGFYNCL